MLSIAIMGILDTITNLKLIDKVVFEGSRVALLKSALLVVKRAKQLAPVDTGKLRASIRILSETKVNAGYMHSVTIRAGGTGGIDYADLVEFGTSRMVAQPYMLPAALGGRSFATTLAERELKNKLLTTDVRGVARISDIVGQIRFGGMLP